MTPSTSRCWKDDLLLICTTSQLPPGVIPEIVKDKLTIAASQQGPRSWWLACECYEVCSWSWCTLKLHLYKVNADWRDANITPLFRKGSRLSPNNYRPVSLTSQVVRILERIIYDQLMDFIVSNQIISCEQHGFQKHCSCVTQLLECFFDWNAYDDQWYWYWCYLSWLP